MSTWSNMSGGLRATALAVGAVMVAAAGYGAWRASQPAVVPAAPPVAAVLTPLPEIAVPEVAVPEVAVPDVAVPPQPTVEAVAEPQPPEFDLVRVDPDGAALVAGRAEPGSQIVVQIDGADAASTPVDAGGKFVAQFTLAASPLPRLMSLMMDLADGRRIASRDTVAIAPVVPPVVVAVVEPAPEPTPAPTLQPAPAPPAALLVTETGVSVLQPATELPADLAAAVSIDTITYAPDGAVLLGGRGQAGLFLRLYLDNAEIATLAVPDGGQWAQTLTNIAPGLYTLRADQLDDAGTVTSRFETPFKRETLVALAEATAPVAEPAPEQVAEPAPVAEPVAEPEPASIATPAPVVEAPPPEPAAPAVAVVAPAVPTTTAPPAAAPVIEPAPVAVAAAEPAAPPLPAAVAPAPAVEQPPVQPPPPVTITVQPGLTLWAIARDTMGEGVMYVEVYEANKDKIRDPNLIYPGQVFTMPVAD